jgi:hypothetical protein
MKLLKPWFMVLAACPAIASADFCDILAAQGALSCRTAALEQGATFFGSWLRTKPELASQPRTGIKGYFVSAATPAITVLGLKNVRSPRMTIECFVDMRSMSIQALPYMLGFANGKNTSFELKFKIDNTASFCEGVPFELAACGADGPARQSIG